MILQTVIEPDGVFIKNLPHTNWFDHNWFYVPLAAFITISAPLLVFYLTQWLNEKEKYDRRVLDKIGFLENLKRLGNSGYTDYKRHIPRNIKFATNVFETNPGGVIKGLDFKFIDDYNFYDVQRFSAIDVKLLKPQHQIKAENNQVNLYRSESATINFFSTDSKVLIDDLSNLYKSVNEVRSIHAARLETLKEINDDTKFYLVEIESKLTRLRLIMMEYIQAGQSNIIKNVFDKIIKHFELFATNNETILKGVTEIVKPMLKTFIELDKKQLPNIDIDITELIKLTKEVELISEKFMCCKIHYSDQFQSEKSLYEYHLQVINDFNHKQHRFYIIPKWWLFISYPKHPWEKRSYKIKAWFKRKLRWSWKYN